LKNEVKNLKKQLQDSQIKNFQLTEKMNQQDVRIADLSKENSKLKDHIDNMKFNVESKLPFSGDTITKSVQGKEENIQEFDNLKKENEKLLIK